MDPTYLQLLALRIPAVLIAITLHELAQVGAATALGDRRPVEAGRASLNPLVHLDPIGTVGLVFGSFGWGRPVPLDPAHARHRHATYLVAAAGPLGSLSVALLVSLTVRAVLLTLPHLGTVPQMPVEYILEFLDVLLSMCLALALFNLLPIHPLAGARFAEGMLPTGRAYSFRRLGQSHGVKLLFALILIGFVTERGPLQLILGPPLRAAREFLWPI